MSFHTHLATKASQNTHYREVLYTGEHSQLVVMSIPAGEDIGEEVHAATEQTLYIHAGSGQATLNEEIFSLNAGDVLVVSAGTKHNIRNVGDVPLSITTVYAPPHHIDGRIHATKADAQADHADEAFGGDAS
ncbi:cupin domain-containing protein [Patescibacteria group bacterium]|nr:cupin domain-containing protein [Patescibacteria group bacterium]MDQ5919729.1 hypothetical protein [Patescibacteria group bacterium]